MFLAHADSAVSDEGLGQADGVVARDLIGPKLPKTITADECMHNCV
jgi:hypothetical protein